jgi:hypothetical protein
VTIYKVRSIPLRVRFDNQSHKWSQNQGKNSEKHSKGRVAEWQTQGI